MGMATKKIIVVPCMVNMRLKTCGETKSLCGTNQLDPHDRRFDPADHEKNKRIEDVHDAQTLVIDGRDPLVQPIDETGETPPAAWAARLNQSTSDVFLLALTEVSPDMRLPRPVLDRSIPSPASWSQVLWRQGFESTAGDFPAYSAPPRGNRVPAHQVRQIRTEATIGHRARHGVAVDAGGGFEDVLSLGRRVTQVRRLSLFLNPAIEFIPRLDINP